MVKKILLVFVLCLSLCPFISFSAMAATDYGVWDNYSIVGPAALQWQGLAISDSGQYISGVVMSGYIFVSTDYGVTFTQRGSVKNWWNISMSGDGQYQTAVPRGTGTTTATQGYIWRSINYGTTWTQVGLLNKSWLNVSMSKSGQYQTAVSMSSANPSIGAAIVSVSSNYGSTWTTVLSGTTYGSVALSESGQYQVIADTSRKVMLSSDYGATWGQILLTSTGYVQGLAMSDDGMRITAVEDGGHIWVSSDRGSNWTEKMDAIQGWETVDMSSDGKYQLAASMLSTRYMAESNDYGQTWSQTKISMDFPSTEWTASCMSRDGFVQVAASYGASSTSRIYRTIGKAFTSFSISGQVSSSIDNNARTISVEMSAGSNISSLSPSFTVSASPVITAIPANGISRDFTTSQSYTLAAVDGSTREYMVTVTVPLSPNKDILSFSVLGVSADIVGDNISLTVPYGTNINNLVATFDTTGSLITVGGFTQISGVTINNFSNPVIYRVTAEDSSAKDYTVIVIVAGPGYVELYANPFVINGVSTSVLTATVRDSDYNLVPDGTNVSFVVNRGSLDADNRTTVDGVAVVTLTSSSESSIVVSDVRALSMGASKTIAVFFTPLSSVGVVIDDTETVIGDGGTITPSVETEIDASSEEEHTITIAQYDNDPVKTAVFREGSSFYDVHLATLDSLDDINSVIIRFPASLGQVYYWTGSEWLLASNQEIEGDQIVVTVTEISNPNIEDLSGLYFGTGEMMSPAASATKTLSGIIPLIIIALVLVMYFGRVIATGHLDIEMLVYLIIAIIIVIAGAGIVSEMIAGWI